MENISDVRCGFFGFGDNPLLNSAELSTFISKSKMGLNLSRATDIPLYSSDRLAQLAGNGCLVLTPNNESMKALFAEDEVSYFSDEKELIEKIKQFTKDDVAWRTTAEAGWRRAHSDYNEQRVAKFVVEAAFGNDFSNNYKWLFTSLPAGIIKSQAS